MAPTLRPGKSRWRGLGQLTPWLLLVVGLLLVRLSKGAGFSDAYALLSRPFWPGPAQRNGSRPRRIWRSALACSCWKTTTVVCVDCWSSSNKGLQMGRCQLL